MKTDLEHELKELKGIYNKNRHPSAKARRKVLKEVRTILIKNEKNFIQALSKDYGYRSEFDSLSLDIVPSVNYARYVEKNVKKWMKKQRRHAGLQLAPSKVEVYYQPLGVVGVVVPWNFPLYLALGPALSALGAGNRVMIKMSEFTPNINKELIKAFTPLSDHLRFYEGEVEVASAFTALPFDHLLFTGSTNVGRIVARAAANNLTPITLELGGKSPAIVTKNAQLDHAVENIILGKTLNAGQVCVAPDYVLIHDSLKEQFVERFVSKVKELHSGEKANQFTHIINSDHYERLTGYITEAAEKGAVINCPIEKSDENAHQIYPTIVTNVTEDMGLMKDEIFGPILPVMTYREMSEVYQYINERPRPLALYVMSTNRQEARDVIRQTHSGGVCVNDTVMHVGAEDAPFGGVGDSGMGEYHGREGFLTFSKAKTVLHSKTFIPRSWFLMKKSQLYVSLARRFFLR